MADPKLTPEQRRDVVARYDTGELGKDIAAAYGIAPSAVSYLAATRTTLHRDAPIAHGERRGYAQHLRRGIPVPADDACGCRAANCTYMRDYNRSLRST
jgi:hypothetical protein